MKNQENNKPNFYRRIMHKYSAFYNENLKKIFRVRADIFAHIIACIGVFIVALWFVTTNEWAINWMKEENALPGGIAFLAVLIVAIAKEVWDYVSKTGSAQGSDLAAGVLTGIGMLGITYSINNWSDQLAIALGFVFVFLISGLFVWGPKEKKGSYFVNWFK